MGCQSSSSAALTEEPLRKPRRPGTVSVGKLASPMSSGLESGAAAGPGTELQRVESLKRVAELVSTREASMKWRRLPRGAPGRVSLSHSLGSLKAAMGGGGGGGGGGAQGEVQLEVSASTLTSSGSREEEEEGDGWTEVSEEEVHRLSQNRFRFPLDMEPVRQVQQVRMGVWRQQQEAAGGSGFVGSMGARERAREGRLRALGQEMRLHPLDQDHQVRDRAGAAAAAVDGRVPEDLPEEWAKTFLG